MRLSCLRACVHLVQFSLTLTLSCLTLVARLSSNPCESLHATATHMLGGKQKFHGQSGFFEAIMRGAVMKKVSGQAFQLDVLEKLRLPVTDDMRTRFAQIDAERAAKREFYYANPREAVKRLRKRAERKHAAWKDTESYGKGVALQLTLGTSTDDDAAEGGDASESAEIVGEAEEESEDEYELICDFCHDGKDAGKGLMHLCEGGDCDRLWHRDCLVPKQDFEEMKDDDTFICPMCRYQECLVSDEDVCGELQVPL